MDIAWVKGRYGERITLLGNIDCDHLLSCGFPAEVLEAVKRIVRVASPGCGHVFASSNSIHSGGSPQSFRIMVEASAFGCRLLQREDNPLAPEPVCPHALRAQEKLNGTLRRIYFFDHTPARVGPAHREEFMFPYLARVCGEFPAAIRIYHICDPHIAHVLPRLADIGIDVLYFAAHLTEVKQALGDRVSLMGNLDPIDLLLRGTPESIAAEARRCLATAGSAAGGYLLAPGGAFIPGTPEQNIRAVLAAVQ